ncbi:hypothetical protein HYH03_005026 [Edaphochlamys debaryana]|uniref:Uncharacterized protein n=1 Tax=Edaphochlamys debaryana TaxID=47281 RepID=A0A836C2S5_9CHLO|nr:hypothetical protein HYH03_005026 [Edaphochlamys debaryana]|eukprot:KAG2497023.1 hypothetical protein HYH03_005026 [Edaphochlamys debaryana]
MMVALAADATARSLLPPGYLKVRRQPPPHRRPPPKRSPRLPPMHPTFEANLPPSSPMAVIPDPTDPSSMIRTYGGAKNKEQPLESNLCGFEQGCPADDRYSRVELWVTDPDTNAGEWAVMCGYDNNEDGRAKASDIAKLTCMQVDGANYGLISDPNSIYNIEPRADVETDFVISGDGDFDPTERLFVRINDMTGQDPDTVTMIMNPELYVTKRGSCPDPSDEPMRIFAVSCPYSPYDDIFASPPNAPESPTENDSTAGPPSMIRGVGMQRVGAEQDTLELESFLCPEQGCPADESYARYELKVTNPVTKKEEWAVMCGYSPMEYLDVDSLGQAVARRTCMQFHGATGLDEEHYLATMVAAETDFVIPQDGGFPSTQLYVRVVVTPDWDPRTAPLLQTPEAYEVSVGSCPQSEYKPDCKRRQMCVPLVQEVKFLASHGRSAKACRYSDVLIKYGDVDPDGQGAAAEKWSMEELRRLHASGRAWPRDDRFVKELGRLSRRR